MGKALFDYEANVENYVKKGNRTELKKSGLKAAETTVYEGMKVCLTKNMSKENDFVNGVLATVKAYDERSKSLEVVTKTGKRLAIHLITEEVNGKKVTPLPPRLGYACAIPKVQGMTLDHVTVWLDASGCKAAAYVAISRVQEDEDYLIAGSISSKHFIPAY